MTGESKESESSLGSVCGASQSEFYQWFTPSSDMRQVLCLLPAITAAADSFFLYLSSVRRGLEPCRYGSWDHCVKREEKKKETNCNNLFQNPPTERKADARSRSGIISLVSSLYPELQQKRKRINQRPKLISCQSLPSFSHECFT